MGNKVERITEVIGYGVNSIMPGGGHGRRDPTEEDLRMEEERRRLRERRSLIAQEILTTEQNYVNTLNELFNKWETPLRNALEIKSIISREEIKLIFSNSEVLFGFHQMLLASLQEKINNWTDGTEIGPIFLENAPVLKLYVEYVNNFDNSMKTITDCVNNKNFMDFLVATVGLVDTYPLSSLLIQPVQRIPRYEMLISDLVKHTWDSHPDMESLQKALAMIKANAQFVNAQKKRFEDSQKLLDIQTKVGLNDLFVPHRVVLIDKDLLLSKNQRPPIGIKCCLLNDSILIWEEMEKSIFNLRQGKVYLFQELGQIVVNDINPECFTFSVEKDEYELFFPPESKITKEFWMKEFDLAVSQLPKAKPLNLLDEKSKPKDKDKKGIEKEKDKEKKTEKENIKEKDSNNEKKEKDKENKEKKGEKDKENKEKKGEKENGKDKENKEKKGEKDHKEKKGEKDHKDKDKPFFSELMSPKEEKKEEKKGDKSDKKGEKSEKKGDKEKDKDKKGGDNKEKKDSGGVVGDFKLKIANVGSPKEKKSPEPTPKEENKSPIEKNQIPFLETK